MSRLKKGLILIPLMILGFFFGVFLAKESKSDEIPPFLNSLNDEDVQYIVITGPNQTRTGSETTVYVFKKDKSPEDVCKLAEQYPEVNLIKVKNYETGDVVYCKEKK